MSIKTPNKKEGMFANANYLLFMNAKILRRAMTDTELALWLRSKGEMNGSKFKRQHPIGNYIADFFCHKAKLVVEIDGSIHNLANVPELDETRQRDLESQGMLDTIRKAIDKLIISQNQNASSIKGV